MILDEGNAGRPRRSPTSTASGGARRQDNAATASPADTAAMTLLLSQMGVQESRDPHATHLDIKGIATLSLAVLCLVLFVTQGPVLGFGSTAAMSIIGMLRRFRGRRANQP